MKEIVENKIKELTQAKASVLMAESGQKLLQDRIDLLKDLLHEFYQKEYESFNQTNQNNE